jgi:hypothetical protein
MAMAAVVDLVAALPDPPLVEHPSKLAAGKEMQVAHRRAPRVRVAVVPEVQALIKRTQIQVRPLVVRVAPVYLILYRVPLFHMETAQMAAIERIVPTVQIQFRIEETVAAVAARTQPARALLAVLVVLEWSSYLMYRPCTLHRPMSPVCTVRQLASTTHCHWPVSLRTAT